MTTEEPTDRSDRRPLDTLRSFLTARSAGDATERFLDRWFRIDTRSLAAVRIALAGTLLADLLHRAPYIELFYTDGGVYPVAAYETTYAQFTGVSLHALSGALWYQQLLFLVAGLFAVAFLLGYRTRLMGAVSLVFLFSLQARNPAVLNGGDRLFRVVLFVALVTPLGERWSIDALRRGTARKSVRGFGTAALLVQPVVVFVSNAILKHRGETWYAGDALGIAMANDVMTVFLGDVIADYPTLLTGLNYAWIVLLAGSPLFLLASAGRLRTVAVSAYVGAFLGMAMTMTVGLFPLALTAAVLPFLPGSFWDGGGRRVPERWLDRRPDADGLGRLARPPLERRLLEYLRRDHDALVSRFLACCRTLPTIVGLCVLVWILLFSAGSVGGYDVPEEIDYAHLDQQRWGLYAPDPGEGYNWYVPVAHLPNGSTVHALGGGEPSFDRPPDAAAEYETFRHRKFMQVVRRGSGEDGLSVLATSYVEWVCRESAERRGEPIDRVTLYRLYQPSPINGTYESEDPTRVTMIEYDCAAGRPV